MITSEPASHTESRGPRCMLDRYLLSSDDDIPHLFNSITAMVAALKENGVRERGGEFGVPHALSLVSPGIVSG